MTPLGFVGTLVYAAIASLALVVAYVVAGPWLGASWVLALFLVGATAAYAALLGSTLRRRVLQAAAALAAGLVALALANDVSELAMGLALVVALVRGFALRRSTPLRTLVVEGVLGGGGLCLARWLAVPGPLGAAAGFWGYALVQSLYFLVPGERREPAGEPAGDPFERAREQLDSLLERG
jgi:hypothetical protein